MGATAMQISIILNAVDRMSSVVDAAVNKSKKSIGLFGKHTNSVHEHSKGMMKLGAGTAMAMATPISMALDKAVEYESQMASVAKVMDMKVKDPGFKKISNLGLELAGVLGQQPVAIGGIIESLAQGGVRGVDEMRKLTLAAGKMAVAFDIDPSLSGEKMMKIRNAMNLTSDEIIMYTDSINKLSNQDPVKASQILDFFSSGGAAAAKSIGLLIPEAAVFASTLISAGKSGEEASTIFERMVKNSRDIANPGGKAYYAGGGGMSGLLNVLETGRQIQNPNARFDFFRSFGEYGIEVEGLAGKLDLFKNSLQGVISPAFYVGSIMSEFNTKVDTAKFQLDAAKAEISALSIEMGNTLLPVLRDVLIELKPVIKGFADWVQQNPARVTSMGKLAIGVGAVSAAVSVLSGAVTILSAALWANPITWIVAGLIALGVAIHKVNQKWDKMSKLGRFLITAFAPFLAVIPILRSIWPDMKAGIQSVTDWFGRLSGKAKFFIATLLNPVQSIIDFIKTGFRLLEWYNNSKKGRSGSGAMPSTTNLPSTYGGIGVNLGQPKMRIGDDAPSPKSKNSSSTTIRQGDTINMTFAPVINGGDANMVTTPAYKKAQENFEDMIKKHMFNQSRLAY